MNKSKEISQSVYFRHIDWSVNRPKLYNLLKELEITGDEAGIIIWRNNQPYVLAKTELAIAARRLDQACNTADGISPDDLRLAILHLIDKNNKNHTLENNGFFIDLDELLSMETENNPYNARNKLCYALWDCGMDCTDYEIILTWILAKFPEVAARYKKWQEKYHL